MSHTSRPTELGVEYARDTSGQRTFGGTTACLTGDNVSLTPQSAADVSSRFMSFAGESESAPLSSPPPAPAVPRALSWAGVSGFSGRAATGGSSVVSGTVCATSWPWPDRDVWGDASPPSGSDSCGWPSSSIVWCSWYKRTHVGTAEQRTRKQCHKSRSQRHSNSHLVSGGPRRILARRHTLNSRRLMCNGSSLGSGPCFKASPSRRTTPGETNIVSVRAG